jgi:hypothetical protein
LGIKKPMLEKALEGGARAEHLQLCFGLVVRAILLS